MVELDPGFKAVVITWDVQHIGAKRVIIDAEHSKIGKQMLPNNGTAVLVYDGAYTGTSRVRVSAVSGDPLIDVEEGEIEVG